MNSKDLEQWRSDWENNKVSGDAYALFLNTYINKREQELQKEVSYWKLSFKKQVEASRNKHR